MMKENNDKASQLGEENKKDSNPLSVRVDPYYKEVFEDLIKQKGIPKKALLEAMISSFAEIENENNRESIISFSNEVSLIAGNLNEIMTIFKTITAKSQDMVGSQKSFYEQRIKNLETKVQSLEDSSVELQEKNKVLELACNGMRLEKDRLDETLRNLDVTEATGEREISTHIRKNAELLEQINSLQKVEKENALLQVELEKRTHELKDLKITLEHKIIEIDRLNKIRLNLEELLAEIKSKNADEFKELERVIRKEAEIDKKMEILHLQSDYNALQADNLKNLFILNQKSEEIAELKVRLEKAAFRQRG